ncbi:MAG: hypothetical protein IPK82_28170 [Polyangiaceae bacterium]|nr:hypothetical protein [Polyangiaceae bacterium]
MATRSDLKRGYTMRGFCRPGFAAFSTLLAAATAGFGCDPADTDETTGSSSAETTTTVECAVNETLLADGRCQPPGLPLDMPCPPGEAPLESGTCQAAGVPPDECGDGFEADGKGGCQPILPSDKCPDGWMAIPGETQCHEVAPCGNGTWGEIPVESDTQFVDGSYQGQDSDGSQNKPWKTIQAGVDAAADGAVVAVAAGVYQENLTIPPNDPIKLWGRCPSMVTVEGVAGSNTPAIVVLADNAEVHNLGVTGNGIGAGIAGSNVLFEKVHIRDTVSVGIVVDGADLRVKRIAF